MRILNLAAFVGVLVGLGVPLHGQSLADVAQKEVERRQTVKDGAKAYTNKDLKAVPQPEPAAAGAPAAADAAEPAADAKVATPAKAEDGKEAKDEPKADAKAEAKSETKDRAYWFGRMRGLREQLERDQMHAEALQSRINGLTADFASRDDPAQRSQIGAAREKALAEFERLKTEITEGTKAVADLEEEARRAGVPPGWLR